MILRIILILLSFDCVLVLCPDNLSLVFPPELSATVLHCITVRGMIALTSPGCLHRPCYRLLASTVSSRVLYAGIEGKRQYRFLERIAKGNHSM